MLKRKYNSCFILEETSEGLVHEVKRPKTKTETSSYSTELNVPSFQRGLVVDTFEGDLMFNQKLTVPQNLQEYEILVKNKYIGLNHVDWKSKKYRFNIYSLPWINGRESSGIVVKRGSKVDKSKFPIAAEVFLASTSYRNLKTSTFQEYTVIDSRLVWNLPQCLLSNGVLCKKFDLDFAAGIGVGLVTAGAALSSIIDLTVNGDYESGEKLGNLVIWGATSSVGIYAIQLARASKRFTNIIAISSKKHESYLRQLGANYNIDRFQSEKIIIEKVLKLCPEGVSFGIDLVSKETATVLSKILELGSSEVKKLICVVGTPILSTNSINFSVDSKLIIETVNIKRFHEDVDFGKHFVECTSRLFEAGTLNPIKGLKIFKALENFGEGIKNGLQELEERGASAEKFVVRL